MSKLIFKFKKDPDPEPHPTEVTQEEKAALFPLIETAVRIIDREKCGEGKPSETWIEDEMKTMRSFRCEPPRERRML